MEPEFKAFSYFIPWLISIKEELLLILKKFLSSLQSQIK